MFFICLSSRVVSNTANYLLWQIKNLWVSWTHQIYDALLLVFFLEKHYKFFFLQKACFSKMFASVLSSNCGVTFLEFGARAKAAFASHAPCHKSKLQCHQSPRFESGPAWSRARMRAPHRLPPCRNLLSAPPAPAPPPRHSAVTQTLPHARTSSWFYCSQQGNQTLERLCSTSLSWAELLGIKSLGQFINHGDRGEDDRQIYFRYWCKIIS